MVNWNIMVVSTVGMVLSVVDKMVSVVRSVVGGCVGCCWWRTWVVVVVQWVIMMVGLRFLIY